MGIGGVDDRVRRRNMHRARPAHAILGSGCRDRDADHHLDLLAEKLPGLSLTSLTGAEITLSKRLRRPVGIVLKSELRGREGKEVLAKAEPL